MRHYFIPHSVTQFWDTYEFSMEMSASALQKLTNYIFSSFHVESVLVFSPR